MKNRGFTLAELLVAMVIVALLIALVMPVVWAARDRSRVGVCMSNFRQLHAGLHLYMDDYGGEYVTGLPPGIDPLYPAYVSDLRIFACPSDPDRSDLNWNVRTKPDLFFRWSYVYQFWGHYSDTMLIEGVKPWRDVYRERGGEFSIIVDYMHGFPQRVRATGGSVLVLRLNGRVEMVHKEAHFSGDY